MVHVKVDPKYFRPTEVVSPAFVVFFSCVFNGFRVKGNIEESMQRE